MKALLTQLYRQETLSRTQACKVVTDLATGSCNPAEAAALLSALNMRAITLEELKGFQQGMLELSPPLRLTGDRLMDVCGTGGDGKHTFNISTITAFVLAGAGIPVAKHGNYGVSSISGSSNVLEHLGIAFPKDESGVRRQLEAANICFIHAPYFHPGMKAIAPIRQQLGIKTFFNMLGPLSNPARPQCQMNGVYGPELLRLYQYLLQDEGNSFTLVHSVDGYDEVSLTAAFHCITHLGSYYYEPFQVSRKRIRPEDLYGGHTIAEAADILIRILRGEGTPAQQEVILVNSALAIRTYRPELTLEETRTVAEDALYQQKAFQAFNRLKYSS